MKRPLKCVTFPFKAKTQQSWRVPYQQIEGDTIDLPTKELSRQTFATCFTGRWSIAKWWKGKRNSKASKASIWHSWGATVHLAMASLLRNKQCDCIRAHKIHSHNTSSKFAWHVTQMISRAYLHTSQKSVEARSNPTWLSACTIAPSAKACILLGHLPRCFPFVVIEPF